jgi:hypothetical protein
MTEVRSDKHGMTEVRSDKHGMTEVRSDKHGMTEVRSDKHGMTEDGAVTCARACACRGKREGGITVVGTRAPTGKHTTVRHRGTRSRSRVRRQRP